MPVTTATAQQFIQPIETIKRVNELTVSANFRSPLELEITVRVVYGSYLIEAFPFRTVGCQNHDSKDHAMYYDRPMLYKMLDCGASSTTIIVVQ